jgi:hypothetical protein
MLVALGILQPMQVSSVSTKPISFQTIKQGASPCLPSSVNGQSQATFQPSSTANPIQGTVAPQVRNGKARLLPQQLSQSLILHLKLVFKMREQDQFMKCLASINDPTSFDYGHFLNNTTLQPYLPTPGEKMSVVSFFSSKGFAVEDDASPIAVRLLASVSTVQQVLGISIALYNAENTTFYGTNADPLMPSNFVPFTAAILGLDNLTRSRTSSYGVHFRPATLSHQCWGANPPFPFSSTPYCPPALQTGYGLTTLYANGYNGAGQKVAIVIGNDEPDPLSAINTYSSEFGLPLMSASSLTVLTPPGDTATPVSGGEGDLDVESVHTIAPGAQIVLVHDNDGISAINYIARNHLAPIVSNSWSFCSGPCQTSDNCDTSLNPTGLAAVDSELAIDAALGLTMLFASGDGGARGDGGVSYFCTHFPASDPNVLAVGGTDLTLTGCGISTCSGYGNENGWADSGGGYSGAFQEPQWQGSTLGNTPGRAVPDVSMFAGSPGVYLYNTVSGWSTSWSWSCFCIPPGGVGGTSLAAPLWAGFLGIVLQMRGGNLLGNPGPAIYHIASGASYSHDFHDITSGNNGYSAAQGWDPVTGWGTPIANNLASDLNFQYFVCTYVNPNSIGASFNLGGNSYMNGQRAPVSVGQTYILQAQPPGGYSFSSWDNRSNHAPSVNVANLGSALTTVKFLSAGWDGVCVGNLAVNYSQNPSTQTLLTGVDSGSGSVFPNCVGGCSEVMGSQIQATATPSSGWQFSSWSTQIGISCSSNPCTFNMPNNAVTLRATFTQTEQISVLIDKSAYQQGETIHYTASGFIPGHSVSSCLSTSNTLPSGVCIGQPSGDSNGNAAGSMFVGTNIPVGPQLFWVVDTSSNPNVDSNLAQLTIAPGGLSQIAGFTELSSGNVLLVTGDIAGNPHGPKPAGVGFQVGRDSTPLGFLSGMLVNTQPSKFDTNAAFVDSSGKPIGSWSIVFGVGGPDVNAVTHYYENAGVMADRAPVSDSVSGGNWVWTDRNGVTVLTVPQSSTAVPPGSSDVFVIQVLKDSGGRLVVLLDGTNYMGTWAAAWYFKNVIYPNISTYTNGYYIVRWTDATSGPDADFVPSAGDTYTILAQGTP